MSKAKGRRFSPAAALRRALDGSAAALRNYVPRLYALTLAALVALLGYNALRYLVEGLLVSHGAPPQVTGVPLRMDAELMRSGRPQFPGVSAVENPRTPPAHYHRLAAWPAPDRFNDCTRSGCHNPLPHSKKKEDRAFLNMHATTLHCGVCHFRDEGGTRALVWYDLENARPRGRPALLEAYDWLEKHSSAEPADYGEAQQRELSRLLASASAEGQNEPRLGGLASEISAVRPGSDSLARLVLQARDAVRRAMRGSYGSKLAVRDSSGKPMLGHPGTEAAVRDWMARGAAASGAAREKLLAAVHPLRRDAALDCTACHRPSGALVDFAAAGYPASRIHTLTEPMVFEMIQHIREGRLFYIPTLGAPSSQPSASQPASAP